MLDGKSHYGDGLYREAEKVLGIDKSQLMQMKSISERFEILVRTKNLSWRHHYEVASIKKITERNGKLSLSNETTALEPHRATIYKN